MSSPTVILQRAMAPNTAPPRHVEESKSPAITPQILALSVHSLRVELHRRNLPTSGLLPELQSRLAKSAGPLTVPTVFPLPTHLPLHEPRRITPARGILRHRVVWITGDKQMKDFWSLGQCGKGNLSRSAPSYTQIRDDSLKGRAIRQLIELEGDGVVQQRENLEHLQLTLVEAYYAAFVEKRLQVFHKDRVMDASEAWKVFCGRCPKFAWMFVAYTRYRSVGWLPRSGLKYGVDWVLYPQKTKRHTHSPYCIVLRFGRQRGDLPMDRSWIGLQNRLRLVKNVAKTLVFTEVYVENGVHFTASLKQAFSAVKIHELTIDRWIP